MLYADQTMRSFNELGFNNAILSLLSIISKQNSRKRLAFSEKRWTMGRWKKVGSKSQRQFACFSATDRERASSSPVVAIHFAQKQEREENCLVE
jgi:hypothetical protein